MIELLGSEVREYLEAMFHSRLPDEVWERIEDRALEERISFDASCVVTNSEIATLRQIAYDSLVEYDLRAPDTGGGEEIDFDVPVTVISARHGKHSRYFQRPVFSQKMRRGKVRELPGCAKRRHYAMRRSRQQLSYGL